MLAQVRPHASADFFPPHARLVKEAPSHPHPVPAKGLLNEGRREVLDRAADVARRLELAHESLLFHFERVVLPPAAGFFCINQLVQQRVGGQECSRFGDGRFDPVV